MSLSSLYSWDLAGRDDGVREKGKVCSKKEFSQCVAVGRVTCRWLTMSVFTETFLVLGLLSLIVATIIGNLLVCLSVILVRKLRKPQNYLLVSLALSDFFVALFVMPFAIVYEIYEGIWPLSSGLCDLWVSGKTTGTKCPGISLLLNRKLW